MIDEYTGKTIVSPLDFIKFTPIQCEIIQEISRTFDRLGAERGVFAALHSWGDTMPDLEVLQMLKELND